MFYLQVKMRHLLFRVRKRICNVSQQQQEQEQEQEQQLTFKLIDRDARGENGVWSTLA